MITAQFNDSYAPISDGVANGVKNYAFWLNRKYGSAYVVTPEFPGYTDCEEFKVIRYKSIPYIPRKPYRIGMHNISFEAKKALREIPLEIIHARSPFSSGVFAQYIAKEKGIPLVASFHTQYYYDIKEQVLSERLTNILLKRVVDFYNSADAVWTVNNKTAGTLRAYGYEGDIDIIGNGTDLEMPVDYQELRLQTGKEYGIGDEEFVMLYVGQLIWHKNLKLIIDGLSEIKKERQGFRMIIAGSGEAETELREYIKKAGVGENIIMTGQIDERAKLRNLYARADLFLFPSIYDTFGIVVREAAALSCPCVLVEGSNAAEDIKDMENGLLCKNDKHSFAKKIMTVMGNDEMLRNIGNNAMKTLPKSWESVVDKAYIKYQEVIESYSNR